MPAAMPCKTPVNCRGETCSSIGKRKTKYACIVDADESMRMRLECVPQKYHEDHIPAKGVNSLSRFNLVRECQGPSGCSGQAADAISAYTLVKMEDALLKIPKSECPDIGIRLPRHTWPTSWSSMEDPVVRLERNLYGHLLAGLLLEKAIRDSSIGTRLRRMTILVCMWTI